MRLAYVMFALLAAAMLIALIPDRSGTTLIVAHMLIAGIAVLIVIGVLKMHREH